MKELFKQTRVTDLLKDKKNSTEIADACKKIIGKLTKQSDVDGSTFWKDILNSKLFTNGLMGFLVGIPQADKDACQISEKDIADQKMPAISDLTKEIKITDTHYLKYDPKA
jgi:hypothetical protein